MANDRVDVAIAGGGPAGAAAAILLARAGLTVLLAEGREPAFRPGEGLPPSARLLLHELGVLEQVLADGHRASPATLAYWGSQTPHCNDYLFQLHGAGLQLDRLRFDTRLRDTARTHGVTVRERCRLTLEQAARLTAPHQLQLASADGQQQTLEARWVIDAGGRPATLARVMGARRIKHDRLVAYYQRLVSPAGTDRDARSWVEAEETGWWYSVLLPGGERLIALFCDAGATAPQRHDSLWQRLPQAPNLYEWCVQHGYTPLEAPRGAEAGSVQLDHAAGYRWLAVGDAALAFDPLSSKGISNALYTGMQAAGALLDSERGDREAGTRYSAHLQAIHQVYRQQLGAFYAMETRWPQAAFWANRHAPAARRSRDATDRTSVWTGQ